MLFRSEVGMSTGSEVANDGPSVASRAGRAIGRQGVIVEHAASFKRIHVELSSILSGLESGPAALVHYDYRVGRFVRQFTDGLGNNADRRGTGDNTDTDRSRGRRGSEGGDLPDQLLLSLLRDAIGQFIINVVKERFTG